MNLREISKRNALLTVALLLLVSFYAALRPLTYIGRFNDDTRHLLAAQSLLSGHYLQEAVPGKPPITNQLPGYPLLLAPAVKLSGGAGGQWENVLFTALAVLTMFFLYRGKTALALLTGLHPALAMLSGTLMSEPAYLLWTLAVFLWLDRKKPNPYAFMLFTAFAVWIRPHGALLLLSVLPFFIGGKVNAKKIIAVIAGIALAAAPFIYNMASSGTPASYFGEIPQARGFAATLASLWLNVSSNILYTLFNLPLFISAFEFLPQESDALLKIFSLSFWAVFAAGAFRIFKLPDYEKTRPRLVYALMVLGLHLFWVNQSSRYFLIVLPFVLETLAAGLFFMPRKAKITLACAFMGLFCVFDFGLLASARADNSAKHGPAQTARMIRENTAPDAILMSTFKEKAAYLTGRQSYGYYYAADSNSWYRDICGMRVAYLWLDQESSIIQTTPDRRKGLNAMTALLKTQVSNPLRFKKVYENPGEDSQVYRLLCPPEFQAAAAQYETALKDVNATRFKQAADKMKNIERAGLAKYLDRFDFTYGTTLMLASEKKEALRRMQTALTLEPDFDPAKKNLALLTNNSK
ncbi:MAG: hypothetical protein WCS77_02275 [Elusimicrobiaceae bacterium]